MVPEPKARGSEANAEQIFLGGENLRSRERLYRAVRLNWYILTSVIYSGILTDYG